MIALLITAATLITTPPSNTCPAIPGNTCCNDCESRETLCQSKSDSLSEALDCLNYHKKCTDKCTHKETEDTPQTKMPSPPANK